MRSNSLLELFLAHPVVQEVVSEAIRAGQVRTILRVLEARFGSAPPTVAAGLQVIQEHQLTRLILPAAVGASLDVFENCLRRELNAPAPISKRERRDALLARRLTAS